MEKDLKRALDVVSQACAVYSGTLQEHQTIQSSLNLLKSSLERLPKEEEHESKEPELGPEAA